MYFFRPRAVTVSPAPTNIRVVKVFWDKDTQTTWEEEMVVMGISAEVTDHYSRPREHDLDQGCPKRPPSLKNLTELGYKLDQLSSEKPRFDILVLDKEFGQIERLETCGSDTHEVVVDTVENMPASIAWAKGRLHDANVTPPA
ncbi:hypothetical protein FRUB_10306 [Fimbriiglobus ruber]|uniref:Uncharacterized protein n=1 Tax=Fimbriiglobus ruber TaxID=1908690 RepID=A0A225DD47_9BACT|nr:hypothetical protein FRUB_10306 [Fimbriiglobus ruber]